MKTKKHIRTLLLACLLVGSNMVYADDDLDVTMRMVPPDIELPDAVTKVIALPLHTPGNAKTNAQKGLDTANEARGKSRDLDIEAPQMPQVELPEQARGRGRH